MYKIVIIDENQKSHEYEGDFIDERYDNSSQRQTLTLVKTSNMTSDFVSSFAPLYHVSIDTITVYNGETEIIKYTEYDALDSVVVHYPPETSPILQGSVIFIKQGV